MNSAAPAPATGNPPERAGVERGARRAFPRCRIPVRRDSVLHPETGQGALVDGTGPAGTDAGAARPGAGRAVVPDRDECVAPRGSQHGRLDGTTLSGDVLMNVRAGHRVPGRGRVGSRDGRHHPPLRASAISRARRAPPTAPGTSTSPITKAGVPVIPSASARRRVSSR